MTKPYGVISDCHLHRWSSFASVDKDGINTRLAGLLSEIERAARTVKAAGGDTLFCAGDLFHVRGNVAPSVLNPTIDCFERVIKGLGVRVHMIPGNHDLEGKESNRLGAAVTALEGVGVTVSHEPSQVGSVMMIPWVESVADLKMMLSSLKGKEGCDLIIHAPVNGVIMGIPDHGLEPAWLASLGFKRVFSGHYHNHKGFPGQVYSIGALAHHTWSDVGSMAGFLIVHESQVDFHQSALPRFVDIPPGTTVADVARLAPGNYLRVRMSTASGGTVEKMRDWLMKAGALGAVVMHVKEEVQQREGSIAASVNSGASIEQSVSEFVGKLILTEGTDRARVSAGALRVLAESEVA